MSLSYFMSAIQLVLHQDKGLATVATSSASVHLSVE